MGDSTDNRERPTRGPLELAVAVADRVRMSNILLSGCETFRSASLDLASDELKIQTNVSAVRFGKDVEGNLLFVFPTFTLHNVRRADEDPEHQLSIKASFVLFYKVDSFDGLNEEHLGAFAATNGVFNAWPYWREFVQSTCARMGLSRPIIIPVFRLGQAEYTNEDAEDSPSPERTDKGPDDGTPLP
jgi:hypothetical protein